MTDYEKYLKKCEEFLRVNPNGERILKYYGLPDESNFAKKNTVPGKVRNKVSVPITSESLNPPNKYTKPLASVAQQYPKSDPYPPKFFAQSTLPFISYFTKKISSNPLGK